MLDLTLSEVPDYAELVTALHAVLALEGFASPSVVPTVTHVAQSDTDVSVRNAAKAVLARLPTH